MGFIPIQGSVGSSYNHVLEMTNYQADHEEKDINYL